MATAQELSDFLASVERRAFKQAAFALRDDHAALDIVQDAMLKLADNYADRPVAEYPMLFQRILQNTLRDYWRRQKVRNLWTTLLSSFGGKWIQYLALARAELGPGRIIRILACSLRTSSNNTQQ